MGGRGVLAGYGWRSVFLCPSTFYRNLLFYTHFHLFFVARSSLGWHKARLLSAACRHCGVEHRGSFRADLPQKTTCKTLLTHLCSSNCVSIAGPTATVTLFGQTFYRWTTVWALFIIFYGTNRANERQICNSSSISSSSSPKSLHALRNCKDYDRQWCHYATSWSWCGLGIMGGDANGAKNLWLWMVNHKPTTHRDIVELDGRHNNTTGFGTIFRCHLGRSTRTVKAKNIGV